MPTQRFATGNSRTPIDYDTNWRVIDIGSGHNPHRRADVLVDKFLFDNAERAGSQIVTPEGKRLVVADAEALPFRDKSFDFAICSHVAEHIANISAFCSELGRVAQAGYLETPSRIAETLRHPPNHRWYVTKSGENLVFSPAAPGYPLGWFGKLFFSLYFYGSQPAVGRDVFAFAGGVKRPLHYGFTVIRLALVLAWRLLRSITYTRLRWTGWLSCTIDTVQR